MSKLKSLLLFIASLTAWTASAESIVGTVTVEDLENVGISTTKTEIAGGTLILSNDAGDLRLAYDDEWGSTLGYGTNSYRWLTVGDSGEIELDRAAVGNTNPTFTSYEQGVMTAGAVFELTAKKTGWMTVLLRMSANKQYVVFEDRTKGIPYTLGMARDNCAINYSLPTTDSGELDFNSPDASKYFIPATKQSTNAEGIPLWEVDGEIIASEEKPEGSNAVREEIEPRQIAPQFVNVIAGVEDETFVTQSFTGFLTFRVKAGFKYYFSALGSKVGCSGFVYTDGNDQPTVTFPATDELPEVKFNSVMGEVFLAAGDDFEYEGIWYTVIDADAKTVKTKDGYPDYENQIFTPGNVAEGSLVIPAVVTYGNYEYTVTEIGWYGFRGTAITSLTLPETVVSLGANSFEACELLTEVVLPEGLKSINQASFDGCKKLPAIHLPEGLTLLDHQAFQGCESLSDVNIPTSLKEIGNGAFNACDFRDLVIPDNIEIIGESSFSQNFHMKSLVIPANVKEIGKWAFLSSTSLEEVTYNATDLLVTEDNIFDEYAYNSVTLKTPNASLADVQATTPWNLFRNINAADGSVTSGLAVGEDFEYEGIWYTVIDPEAKTCKTKEGTYISFEENISGNDIVGEVIIPAVVSSGNDSYTVVEIGAVGFTGNAITSISFPETISSIGEWAFARCENLTSLFLPDNIQDFGEHAFRECINLVSVHLPDNLQIIQNYLFTGCENLSEINIPNSLISIGHGAFNFCALTSLELPEGFKTFGDTGFNGNPLKTIILPASITSFGEYVFLYCRDLENVSYDAEIPIAADASMFSDEAYENVTLNTPNATLASVQATVPWNMFGKIVASDGSIGFGAGAGEDFEYEGVIYTVIDAEAKTCKTKDGRIADDQFVAGNDYKGDLMIPSTVSDGTYDYSVIAIGRYGFANATDLTSVSISELISEIPESAFNGCTSLYSAKIPSSVTSISVYAFYKCSSLGEVFLPDGLTELGYGAFGHCTSLQSIFIPEGVTRLQNQTFGGCTSLSLIDIPAGVTSFDTGVFFGCAPNAEVIYRAETPLAAEDNLFDAATYNDGKLEMPYATIASVQATAPWNKFLRIFAYDGSVEPAHDGDDFEYEGLWYTVTDAVAKTVSTRSGSPIGDGQLQIAGNEYEGNLTIPANVVYNFEEYTVTEIGDYGFSALPNLTSVTIPASVRKVGLDAFYQCAGLTSVSLPSELSDIRQYAFSECRSLTEISLPDSLTSIANNLFAGCTSLGSVAFPDGLISIGETAFSECRSLKEITLPDGLTHIGVGAFSNCENLDRISIPASLQTAGTRVFANCFMIDEVTYVVEAPASLGTNTFEDLVYDSAVLNMPATPLSVVQSTTPWNRFGHIVASDASVGFGTAIGEDFEFEGIIYTVIDADAKTVKTKDGYYDSEKDANIPGNEFEGELVIPAVVSDGTYEYTVTEIGYYGFVSTDVTSVTLPESVWAIRQFAFDGCKRLRKAVLPEGLTLLDYQAFQWSDALSDINIPASLTEIRDGAFNGCGFTSLVIPENIVKIGQSSISQNYYMTSLTLPGSISEFGQWAFSADTALTEVTYNAEKPLSSFDNIFSDETYQNATLFMPNAVLADVHATAPWNKFLRITAADGSVAPAGSGEDFEYEGVVYTVLDAEAKTCKTKDGSIVDDLYLAGNDYKGDLVIPSMVSDGLFEYSVIAIGRYGFANADGLTSVSLSEQIAEIPESAFRDCANLHTVKLPYSVASIGVNAFAGCSSLSDISLPADLTSIGHSAFYGCGLKSVVIPDGVTRLMNQSFAGCSSLSMIDIPAGITYFDYGVFLGCASDAEVIYRAVDPVEADEDLFNRATYRGGRLVMPNATVKAILEVSPWNKFITIEAADGSVNVPQAGETIEVGGLTYEVIDEDNHLVKTIDGQPNEGLLGNSAEGNLEIPVEVESNGRVYTVTEIGTSGFWGNSDLRSVTIPGTVTNIGSGAFFDCESLTSIIWNGDQQMPDISKAIDNPNMLVFVDNAAAAPKDIDHNVVAADLCDNLVLTPGYAFAPARKFVADHSEMTQKFTQKTPMEGCAGWETIALPFQPLSITTADGRELVPFSAFTDIDSQCPFWLYEADADGEWKAASEINQAVPYILSMPNNDNYDPKYCVEGPVTFMSDKPNDIYPETCTPHVTTWNSGREFRSLWLPLTKEEADNAMGLNVGIADLTDDDGQPLAPGSAFHTGVLPLPMEAYVTRIDGRRAMPVRGFRSLVLMMDADDGLRISTDLGEIVVSSDRDRKVDVLTIDGIVIRRIDLKAGITYRVENLTRGIYIVAGHKLTVK